MASSDMDLTAALASALDAAYRAQVWYFEGPYGPSPDEEDLQVTRDALARYRAEVKQ
jgi:hypothetical protein